MRKCALMYRERVGHPRVVLPCGRMLPVYQGFVVVMVVLDAEGQHALRLATPDPSFHETMSIVARQSVQFGDVWRSVKAVAVAEDSGKVWHSRVGKCQLRGDVQAVRVAKNSDTSMSACQ